jgi:hypothetical protein
MRQVAMKGIRAIPYAVLAGIVVQFALTAIITAALLRGRISPLANSSGQILYALTAAAQVLASLLGLLLAVALVVAQLTSSYSRTTTTNLIIRPTLAIGTLYTLAIAASVTLAATRRPTPLQATWSLAFSFLCLFLIIPFFLLLKRQLSIESAVRHLITSYERARKRTDKPDLANSRLRHVTEYGVAAASQRDLKAYSSVTAGLASLALGDGRALDSTEIREVLASLTMVIGPAEGDPILSASALRAISESMSSSQEFQHSDTAAQIISLLIRPLIIRLLQREADDDHTAEGPIYYGIEMLSMIGRQASANGDAIIAAASVGVLAELRFKASDGQLLTVAGRSARALARIGRPRRESLPLPLPQDEEWPLGRANLVLNGGFEFGHDAGYGREPGWFSSLYARQLDSRALPREEPGCTRNWTLRLHGGVEGASVAQDIVPSGGILPGDTFFLFSRLAADASPALARLSLWALGGIEERGVTNVELTESQFNVIGSQLDVRFPGHHALRAELYIDSPQLDYYFDDVFVVRSLARNGGFELGTFEYWRLKGSGRVLNEDSTPPWLGGEFFGSLDPDASIEQVIDLSERASPQADHVIVSFATRCTGTEGWLAITVSTATSNVTAWARSDQEWRRIVRALPTPPGSATATLTIRSTVGFLIDAVIAVATKGAPGDEWWVISSPQEKAAYQRPEMVNSKLYGISSWIVSPSQPLEVRRLAAHAVEPGLSISVVTAARLSPDFSREPEAGKELVTAGLIAYDRNGIVVGRRSCGFELEDTSWKLVWITFDVDSWDCWDIFADINCTVVSGALEIMIPTSLPLVDTCTDLYGTAMRSGDRG